MTDKKMCVCFVGLYCTSQSHRSVDKSLARPPRRLLTKFTS